MRTGQVSKRLGVDEATIRDWATKYGDHLTPKGRGAQDGATRNFSEKDLLVLATVNQLRTEGMPHEDILQTLESGWRAEKLPDAPSKEEEEVRQKMPLMPTSTGLQIREQYELLFKEHQNTIEALLDSQERERDLLRQLADLERKVGAVDGKDELIRRQDDQLKALKEELDAVRKQLDGERDKKRGWFGR